MITDEQAEKLVEVVRTKAICDVFETINQAAITPATRGKAGYLTVNAWGEGWNNQIVLLSAN